VVLGDRATPFLLLAFAACGAVVGLHHQDDQQRDQKRDYERVHVRERSVMAAAPQYEWGKPSGKYQGRKPKGVVMVIHGGGWVNTGPALVAQQRPTADWYQRHGWKTMNVDYRPGVDSIKDVVRFYDRARHLSGKNTPIVAQGQSAGGNLAMLLATRRPRVAGVISEGGPAAVGPLLAGGTDAPNLAAVRQVFNPATAREFSPAEHLGAYHGRILAAYSPQDQVIPMGPQLRALNRARRTTRANIQTVQVPGTVGAVPPAGASHWVHLNVRNEDLRALQKRQAQFLTALALQGMRRP
jgi:acetyl esterase/lipase